MKKRFTSSILAAFAIMLLFSFKLQAQSCEAGFSYTPPDPNGMVVFQDTSWSQDQIISWIWDLGDGTVATTPVYTHLYTSNGTYQVCLIIESATCIDTVCQYIAVTLANPCNIGVSISLVGPPPQNSLLADISGGSGPYSFSWSTGETTEIIQVSSSMNYCVTVTDNIGCTATACYNYNSNCNLISTIVADTTFKYVISCSYAWHTSIYLLME
jgi:PKD repeat protein